MPPSPKKARKAGAPRKGKALASKPGAAAKRARGRPRLDDSSTPADTRALILDSALEVFAEYGFDAASTRQIAARAGVTHTMITYYFAAKEDLWKEAVDFLFERQLREVAQPLPKINMNDAELLEFARDTVRLFIRYCARHPEHLRIMIQESMRDGPRLAWAAKKHIAPTHAAATAWVRTMQDRGLLVKVDPVIFFYMLNGACRTLYALAAEVRHVWGRDTRDEDLIERHIDAVIQLVLPGPAKKR